MARRPDIAGTALGQPAVALIDPNWRRRQPLAEPFLAAILASMDCRKDLDNLVKPLLDWAQSRELIRNDRDCVQLLVVKEATVLAGNVRLKLGAPMAFNLA